MWVPLLLTFWGTFWCGSFYLSHYAVLFDVRPLASHVSEYFFAWVLLPFTLRGASWYQSPSLWHIGVLFDVSPLASHNNTWKIIFYFNFMLILPLSKFNVKDIWIVFQLSKSEDKINSSFYVNRKIGFIKHWNTEILQYAWSLLYWSQISLPGALFSGLQAGSSRWEPGPENTVDGKEIQSAIREIWPLVRATCDTVHRLGEEAHFSSSFEVVFHNFFFETHP